MEYWCAAHREFVYDTFMENNKSIMKELRVFRIHFNIGSRITVLSRKTFVKWWVTAFRTSETIKKQKKHLCPNVLQQLPRLQKG